MYTGSSPRVRGTLGALVADELLRRFIPACAGNSAASASSATPPAVHPRVCGELSPTQRAWYGSSGSSPRVRGTPTPDGVASGLRRFIPACAGNSAKLLKAREYRYGSSPRVRGTRQGNRAAQPPSRFIPACAGNSRVVRRVDRGGDGSSPRVRGTLICLLLCCLPRRFIPACAGNSRLCVCRRHLCTGSSPRVRGTPHGRASRVPGLRFIPACAGNSFLSISVMPFSSVHPRVCGELNLPKPAQHRASGSSPRVRGTQRFGVAQRLADRFIPACAGNSV